MPILRPLFESHITINPVMAQDNLEVLQGLAQQFGFKIASLFMLKGGERSDKDTFMTGHGSDAQDLQNRMAGLIRAMQMAGLKVLRYKIEHILVDSRVMDELALLSGEPACPK